MGSATIFSGGYAKVLAANGIKLKDDTLVLHGTIDPTITNPSAPDGSIYLSDYGLFNRVGGVWVKLSDKVESFIKNSSFETDVSGWVTYADAASSSPTDGTGGSANVTFARNTTLPLSGVASGLFTKDAVNRQGQGFSYDFTIDNASKGKVLALRFDYQIASGTYASGDLSVWVYDVTNARMIQPAPTQIQNSGIIETFLGEFQSSIDSTSYRLIVHVSSTSASAYTVKFDNFYVGRVPKVYGSVATDWVSYVPIISTASGTMTNVTATGKWRRIGDTAEIQFRIVASGSTGTWTSPSISLPSGLSVDTNKKVGLFGASIGNVALNNKADNTYFNGKAYFVTGNTVTIAYSINANGAATLFNQGSPFTFDTDDTIEGSVTVPIQGWSSSQQLSNDADTRVISAHLYATATQTVANSTETKLALNTALFDDVGGLDSANNRYVVKVPGKYRISANVFFSPNSTGIRALGIRKNGGGVTRMQTVPSGINAVGVTSSATISAVAGDYFEVFILQTSGGNLDTVPDSGFGYLSLERISGPSQIAASETVSAILTQTSGQVIPNNSENVLLMNVKNQDTHNAYNTSTGLFTAPVSGTYQVNFNLSISANATGVRYAAVRKNGTGFRTFWNGFFISSTGQYMVSGTANVQLLQGETISMVFYQNSGGNLAMVTLPTENGVSIHRIGNY